MTDYFDLATGGNQDAAPKLQTVDYFDHATGLGDKGARNTVDPNAEPDAATWFGRRVQDFKGKQDQRYKKTGTVYDQFPDELSNTTAIAAIKGASDPQMGDVIQNKLGAKFIRREQDANGYDVFVTRGANGQEQKGYLNNPGLDLQDVSRGVYGALPYAVTGGAAGVAGRGSGVAVNALLQGGSMAATSVAGDIGLEKMGSEQGVEIPKALVSGVFGAAGPIVGKIGGALVQRFITEPRLFDRATGILTNEGKAAAQRMGLDPHEMAAEAQRTFGKTYAASPQDAANIAGSGRLDFNTPQTLGQRSKDPAQLMIEKAARNDIYGPNAKAIVTGLDAEQKASIETAARSTIPKKLAADPSGAPMPQHWQDRLEELPDVRLDPAFHGQEIQDTLQSARASAKTAEGALWDQTGPIYPGAGASQILKDNIGKSLGDYAHVFDEVNTPVAHRMGQRVLSFMEGEAPKAGLSNAFGLPSNANVDTMRRSLGMMLKDAQTPTDRSAAGAIYRGYNEGLKDAARQGALSGNIEDIQKFNKDRKSVV